MEAILWLMQTSASSNTEVQLSDGMVQGEYSKEERAPYGVAMLMKLHPEAAT